MNEILTVQIMQKNAERFEQKTLLQQQEKYLYMLLHRHSVSEEKER